MGLRIEELPGAVQFAVRVSPRSSRDKVLGVHDGALKLALKAPPVDGEANAALIAFLAKGIGCPKRSVHIVQGESSRNKLIRVTAVTRRDVQNLLA